MTEQSTKATYDDFLETASGIGFAVSNADFGGLEVNVYIKTNGNKKRSFSSPEDLIEWISILYGIEIEIK